MKKELHVDLYDITTAKKKKQNPNALWILLALFDSDACWSLESSESFTTSCL